MRATSPEQIHRIMEDAFNVGDEDAMMQLYEPNSTFLAGPGQTVTGAGPVREALRQFLALNGQLTLDTKLVAQADDIALLVSDWKLTGTGPDGNDLNMGGRTAEVARRQSDGSWLYVIDNPWGEQILG